MRDSGGPVTKRIDFLDARLKSEPMAVFDQWRSHGEIFETRLPIVGRVWLTTTHEAATAVLKDKTRFSMRSPKTGQVVGLQWWMPRDIALISNNMLTMDEPDHRRLRGIVDHAFQRRPITHLTEKIQSTADDLADRIASQDGPFDLVPGFARRLPLIVICDLLGITEAERERFAENAGKLTQVSGPISFLRAFWPLRRLRRQIDEMVRSQSAREGLLGELVAMREEGAEISHDEMVAMVFLLLLAGHETTTHLISGSVATLLAHPKQKQWLLEDEARYDLAVEEMLRFVAPVQFTKPRNALEDMELCGVSIKRGDRVLPCLGAANCDPAHVDDPHRLDLSRHPNPHLSFGTGIHFCLGFQLARLELKIALQTLFSRFPDMYLAPDGAEWSKAMGMRAYKRLEILKR